MNSDAILDLWREWQTAQGLSERTIGERTTTMRHVFNHTGADPLDLTPIDIVRYVGRDGISASSKASYHASIRAYCTWLIRADLRTDDPSAKTPRPKRPKGRPRPVRQSQLKDLLAACSRRRTRTYVLLAAGAGMRVHEIAKFAGPDIDTHTGAITITGKGGKTAFVPAHELLLEEAQHYPRDDYWFPAYSAQSDRPHVQPTAVSHAIGKAMKRAGIYGTAHQLRHWYGTTLSNEGTDLRVVQELMRHESPATTAIYTEVDFERLRAAIASLRIPRIAA